MKQAFPWHQFTFGEQMDNLSERIKAELSSVLQYSFRNEHIGMEIFSHLSYRPELSEYKTARDLHSILKLNRSADAPLQGNIHFPTLFNWNGGQDWDLNIDFAIAWHSSYQRLAWLGRSAVEFWAAESVPKHLQSMRAAVFQSRLVSEQAIFLSLKGKAFFKAIAGGRDPLFAYKSAELRADIRNDRVRMGDSSTNPLFDDRQLEYLQGYKSENLDVLPLVQVYASFFFATIGGVLIDSNLSWSTTRDVLNRLLDGLVAEALALDKGRKKPPALRTLRELSALLGFPLQLDIIERAPARFAVQIRSLGRRIDISDAESREEERFSAIDSAAKRALEYLNSAAGRELWHRRQPTWPPTLPTVKNHPFHSTSRDFLNLSATTASRKREHPDVTAGSMTRPPRKPRTSSLTSQFTDLPPADPFATYLEAVVPQAENQHGQQQRPSLPMISPAPPFQQQQQPTMLPLTPMTLPTPPPQFGHFSVISHAVLAPQAAPAPPAAGMMLVAPPPFLAAIDAPERAFEGRMIRLARGCDQYQCVLCRKDCSGTQAALEHLQGKQHKNVIKFLQLAERLRAEEAHQPIRQFSNIEIDPPLYETNITAVTPAEAALLGTLQIGAWCCPCCLSLDATPMQFSSPVTFADHIAGAAHQRQARFAPQQHIVAPQLRFPGITLAGPPPEPPPRRFD